MKAFVAGLLFGVGIALFGVSLDMPTDTPRAGPVRSSDTVWSLTFSDRVPRELWRITADGHLVFPEAQ